MNDVTLLPRASFDPDQSPVRFIGLGKGVVRKDCAMIDRWLFSIDDYLVETTAIRRKVRDLAADHGFDLCQVHVNAADNVETASLYLTVTAPRPKPATTARSDGATG
jgi:S-adenosylmethionine synthetase